MAPAAVASSQSTYKLIHDACPSVHDDILKYAAGFIDDSDEEDNTPTEYVQSLLLSAGAQPTTLTPLITQLNNMITARIASNPLKKSLEPVRLESTVHMSAQKGTGSTLNIVGPKVDLDSVTGRKVETRVDVKKLEKAERKIRAKWEKRANVAGRANYESSKLIQENEQKAYEEFFMSVNPLQMGTRGKSRDIKIDGIDLFFAGNRLLTDASLTLAYGRRYGLVGNNGVGKSTLLRALSRREVAIPTHISILHVEQEVTGDDTPALQSVLDADVWRKYLLREQEEIGEQMNLLDATATTTDHGTISDPKLDRERKTLDSRLTEVHEKLAELDADTAEARASSILAGLGFSAEAQHRKTKEFSGGWRMRLALARALFCKPDLLLLDEPSNMLDVPSVAYLAHYLLSYPSTVLVVSHDRDFLDEVATDIIHQHSERLDYYKGDFSTFQSTKDERAKNQLREYENQLAVRKHLQTFIDKFRYNAAKSSEAQSRIKKLERLPKIEPPEEETSLTFKFPEPEKLPLPILRMNDVGFGYDPEVKLLLKNIDIDVDMESRVGIVGANGSGKTTMLKVLTEQLEPTKGMVHRHPRLRIGFFAQHHVDALDLNASAVSFMAKTYPGKSDEEYRRALGSFGITGTTGLQQMATLSGGQKSRVAFACLALQNPHILILDEPTNHLDLRAMDALTLALKEFKGGVLLVSHDTAFIRQVCDSIWVCQDDTIKKFPGTIKDYTKMVISQADSSGVVAHHHNRAKLADAYAKRGKSCGWWLPPSERHHQKALELQWIFVDLAPYKAKETQYGAVPHSMDSTLTETTAIEATVNGARAADKETVTSLVARGMDPEKAVTTIFTEQAVGLKAETKIHDNYAHEQLGLDAVAKKGNFPYRPSDMFLRMYAAAVDAAEKEPKTAVCSPSLLGSSGVCTLSIVSVIPDIMQHYHNIIVTAQKEVLIATNAWEPGKSVELVTTALQELNDRAAKDGRRVVVKVLMDAANIRNAIQSRFEKKPSTWSKMGIPHDRLDNIDLDLMNYHIAPLGTFHSKFAVIDRQIALVNSNNINIRSNVEMMCQYEGDIVNSLYDAFIISWGKQMDPPLPCISTPALANRDFHFGDRKAYLHQDTSGSTTTGHTQSDGSKGQLDGRTMDDTHKHDDHAGTPAKEIREESERYNMEDHAHTTVPITERLNVMKLADATIDGNEGGMDFKPFYFHSPHDPVPMALVNRQPQPIPGHHDLHNPQNAVWLQALKLANKEVFIQSPVFNASPVVDAVLEACKRGVTVTLYIGLGFNDFAEGIVPFQGGTNDTVRGRMQAELTSCNKQQYLKWHWYVAKDQNAPLRFEKQSRNNHVKFLQVDGQVAVQGSGNMDTQSWFHSQEVNVMVDSPQLVKEWMENFAANQNTGKYGLTDENGKLVSGKPVPEKKGIGGISRSSGGFL